MFSEPSELCGPGSEYVGAYPQESCVLGTMTEQLCVPDTVAGHPRLEMASRQAKGRAKTLCQLYARMGVRSPSDFFGPGCVCGNGAEI